MAETETDIEKWLREYQESQEAARIFVNLANADRRLGSLTTTHTAANTLVDLGDEDRDLRANTIHYAAQDNDIVNHDLPCLALAPAPQPTTTSELKHHADHLRPSTGFNATHLDQPTFEPGPRHNDHHVEISAQIPGPQPLPATREASRLDDEDLEELSAAYQIPAHVHEDEEETEVEEWELLPRRRIHQSPADSQTPHPTTTTKKKARTPIQSAERMKKMYSRLRVVNGVQSDRKIPVVFINTDTLAENSCPICGHQAKRPDHLKEHFSPCVKTYGNPTAACWDDNVVHKPNTDNFLIRAFLRRRRQGDILSFSEARELDELSSRKENEYENKLQSLQSVASQTQDTDVAASNQNPRKRRRGNEADYLTSAPENQGESSARIPQPQRLPATQEPDWMDNENPVNPKELDDEETEEEQWELQPRRNDHHNEPSAQAPEPQLVPANRGLEWMDDEDDEELLAKGYPVRARRISKK